MQHIRRTMTRYRHICILLATGIDDGHKEQFGIDKLTGRFRRLGEDFIDIQFGNDSLAKCYQLCNFILLLDQSVAALRLVQGLAQEIVFFPQAHVLFLENGQIVVVHHSLLAVRVCRV